MVKPVYIIDLRVDWRLLSENPNAIHLLEQNLDKVDWYWLSYNPNAIHLLEQNVDKICWHLLSQNPNPNAMHLLEQNLNKVNWRALSKNPNAMHLLAKLDYNRMRLNNQNFVQELVAYICNPNWIQKCATRLNMEFDEYQDLLIECNVI